MCFALGDGEQEIELVDDVLARLTLVQTRGGIPKTHIPHRTYAFPIVNGGHLQLDLCTLLGDSLYLSNPFFG